MGFPERIHLSRCPNSRDRLTPSLRANTGNSIIVLSADHGQNRESGIGREDTASGGAEVSALDSSFVSAVTLLLAIAANRLRSGR